MVAAKYGSQIFFIVLFNTFFVRCTLAARIDRAREHSDGYLGKQFRDEIVRKLEKSLEPPPTKSIKALAVPTEGRKSRRAGRRLVPVILILG